MTTYLKKTSTARHAVITALKAADEADKPKWEKILVEIQGLEKEVRERLFPPYICHFCKKPLDNYFTEELGGKVVKMCASCRKEHYL